jgi:hypothetical protein
MPSPWGKLLNVPFAVIGRLTDSKNQSRRGTLWNYDLSGQAPDYNEMWWYPTNWSDMQGLFGNYGNAGFGANGIYNNHGDQNPIVPDQGNLFVHRGNAIIAFGNAQPKGKLALLTANPVEQSLPTPTLADLKSRLKKEIEKIVAAGHLRPGYYNAGQFNDNYLELSDYFSNPGDTLYTLSAAYPHLSPTLQQQVKTYLQNEFSAYFDPIMYASIGWAEGVGREAMPLPPEVAADLTHLPKSTAADVNAWSWRYFSIQPLCDVEIRPNCT